MGYDRGDSFPFDFEQNGIPYGSKSKGKLSPRSYPNQCERKWKSSFLSVETNHTTQIVLQSFLISERTSRNFFSESG